MEEAMMERILTSVATVALTVSAMIIIPSLAAGQTAPPIGGGYQNVIPIPVNDLSTKAIAGALFKPAGAGPFPAIVYMSGCGGLSNAAEMALEKTVIDHLLAKGVATFVVDPFTPRNEPQGICANLNEKTFVPYASRGGNDAVAALKVVKAMPDIDPNRVFLEGYSFGAISSLFATDTNTPGNHDTKIAGLIAYYPYCYDKVEFSAPTLVLIGDKDDWTPAVLCQTVKSKPNVEVVVFPGATHAFVMPFSEPVDYLGHHFVYDEKAAQVAQQDADAFMAAHVK
jgi:dienelactone hydrolase